MTSSNIKRALISVSNKAGLVEFSRELYQCGIEILSTGGTASLLRENGIPVVEVSEHTGFPEIMAGRVKTLHPHIHGGILARRGTDDAAMDEHGIKPIDLVVVNLYPFEQVTSAPECSLEQAVENIDIGGPTMVRAAAKNYQHVTVVVESMHYDVVLNQIKSSGGTDLATRLRLALAAFEHTARYDALIAKYLGEATVAPDEASFPSTLKLQFRKKLKLRYGENPHQQGAFYTEYQPCPGSIATAKQLQGKELSFNNIGDTDAALECVKQFPPSSCVIVKHANPCGVATAPGVLAAYERAYATDPESAFGGIIAFNAPLTGEVAREIINRQFVEVIVAPRIETDAQQILAEKRNVRVLECSDMEHTTAQYMDFKRVNGGLLVQNCDAEEYSALTTVTERGPEDSEAADLLFAWRVARFVKSNAIVYASALQTIGVGAGQMSRVNSARIAGIKAEHAGLQVMGSVMASDAFFPFRDAIDTAAAAGIRAIIQPGGSVQDNEVIAACNEHDMAMVFTAMRHFRH